VANRVGRLDVDTNPVTLSDELRNVLRVLDALRDRLADEYQPEREVIEREIASGETSLRRALHLIGG